MTKSIGPKPLLFCTPVWVIGSYDADGRPNLMTAAWGGTACSDPPCVAVSLRKATYTYSSIAARQAFSVNIPSEQYSIAADYFGLATGKQGDKFAAAGLTPVRGAIVDAPLVKEFPVTLECRVRHTVEIGLHTQFIGEIMDIRCDEAVLDGDGLPDIEKVKPLVYDPAHSRYFALGKFMGEAFHLGRQLTKVQ